MTCNDHLSHQDFQLTIIKTNTDDILLKNRKSRRKNNSRMKFYLFISVIFLIYLIYLLKTLI